MTRATQAADASALAEIYADAVLHGLGTFEEVPPSPAEMETRRAAVVSAGLPHLVAERDGQVAGFAYAAPFRLRLAYRYTVEDTVYVRPGFQGRGVGRELLSAVVAECEVLGLRQIVALIGDSDNASSIGLHAALGFAHAGLLPAVGFKHGRWVDAVWMRRDLNGGAASLPNSSGLVLAEP